MQLFFIARGQSGKSVQDLQAGEVTVLDNGAPAKVLKVERGDGVPVRLGILLYSDQASFKTQQDLAIRLLGKLRSQVDQAFVVTQAATNKAGAWPDKSTARAWPVEQVVWSTNPPELISLVHSLQWNTALVGTAEIAQKMLGLDQGKQFRKLIVQFRDPQSESMVEWGPAPYKELEQRQVKEITDYQRVNAAVYTLGLLSPFSRSLPPTETMSRENAQYLASRAGESKMERISAMTGGRYFASDPDVKSEVAAIQADIESEFVVTFATPMKSTAELPHKLELRVSRKDIRVSIQSQYYPLTSQ